MVVIITNMLHIFSKEIDSDIFDATLRSLSPTAMETLAPYLDTFQAVAFSKVTPKIVNASFPRATSLSVIRRLAIKFVKKIRQLADQQLFDVCSDYAPCHLCLNGVTNCQVNGLFVHRECWMQWRLVHNV